MPGRFRLTDMELDFVSLVHAGDDPEAQVVIAKAEHSSRSHPSLERKKGGDDNWVEAAGGLPSYIERIAKHLHYDQGMSISHAIATAVNQVKKWSAGGGEVSKETQAKAAKAVAQWEAKKRKVNKSTEGEATASTLSPDSLPKEKNMGDIAKSDLDPEVVAYIDALEAEVDTLSEAAEVTKSEIEKKDQEIADLKSTVAKSAPLDPEAAEKEMLAKADPALRAIIEKNQKAAEEAQAIAKAERDARLEREFIAKAEALPMLTEDKTTLAGVLRRAAESLSAEDQTVLNTVLKAANEQIAKSNLFSTMGNGGAETTISKSVEAKAEEIRKADPTLTREQAIAKAYEDDPSLFQQAMTGQEG